MHAFYLHGRRDLRNEQVDPPSPAADEVLVRFRAGGICGNDMHYYNYGRNSGFDLVQPLVLGLLAIFVLGLGLWPAPLVDVMSASVDNLVDHIMRSKL